MLGERVARFADMRPSPFAFLDSRLPEHEKESFHVIGVGVTENQEEGPAIADASYFNVNYTRAKPGKGAALHAHPTVEVFIPMSGRWSVQYGSDRGIAEVELGPLDVISVPEGVMRGFKNISDDEALLLVIFGGTDAGHVQWDPDVIRRAEETGVTVSADGTLVDVPSTGS